MLKSRRMAWAFVVVAAFVLGSTAAQGAEKEKIGVVDVQKLMDSPRVKQYGEEFRAFTDQLDRKLTIRSQKLMLTEDEIKELVDLTIKTNQTEADKTRIKALEDTEKQRDAELQSLQQAANASDQQKNRLKELMDMRQKATATGTALEKDYEGQAQSKLKEMNDKIEAEVQDVINKVAEAEGFTLVFNKSAALYGGIDITDKVIQKLDRKIK